MFDSLRHLPVRRHAIMVLGGSLVPRRALLGAQGRPAPTRPPVERGSKDTTVPVCAAWMIVFAP